MSRIPIEPLVLGARIRNGLQPCDAAENSTSSVQARLAKRIAGSKIFREVATPKAINVSNIKGSRQEVSAESELTPQDESKRLVPVFLKRVFAKTIFEFTRIQSFTRRATIPSVKAGVQRGNTREFRATHSSWTHDVGHQWPRSPPT